MCICIEYVCVYVLVSRTLSGVVGHCENGHDANHGSIGQISSRNGSLGPSHLCVCVHVCMRACMYERIFVWMNVSLCEWMYVRVWIYTDLAMFVFACWSTHACSNNLHDVCVKPNESTDTSTFSFSQLCDLKCMGIRAQNIHIHIQIYIYISMLSYMHAYVPLVGHLLLYPSMQSWQSEWHGRFSAL